MLSYICERSAKFCEIQLVGFYNQLKCETEGGKLMKKKDTRLVDWAINKIETEYRDDVCMSFA